MEGTRSIFLILTIVLRTCSSISTQSNEEHQSINEKTKFAEDIADSRKHDYLSSLTIENDLYGIGLEPLQKDIFECGAPENLHEGNFSFYDYAIVCGMLIISLGIGVFYGFFQRSEVESPSNEFLLGSQMTILPVTLSLTTSFITAIELLGNPAEMFYNGTQFSLIVIPMAIVIPVAVKMFYPIYFQLELTSCYEYLGIRFGKEIRILGATLYIIQMCFYTSVAVLAPAIALSKATGLNTRLAVVLIYIVCIFYSSQGGIKAVVIADTFQACVLAASLVILLVLGHFYTGGYTKVLETASEYGRLEFFNFDPNPTTRHTVFSIVVGGFFYWASMFCTNQASVQKCMSLKSLKLARLALIFAILGLILVFIINFYTGLLVFTEYAKCDPLSSGQIGARDQLLPFYVMQVYEKLYTITGIFVAGIFAASLGTVASALNSLAAVTCEDIITCGFNIKLRPEQGATYAKWMSLGYGIFSFILVFVVEQLGSVLQATLTLNGLIGGITLGLFSLGIIFKCANTKGAFYAGILSLIIVIYIGVMAQIYNKEAKTLALSMDECNCLVNGSSNKMKIDIAKNKLPDDISLIATTNVMNMANTEYVTFESTESSNGFSFSYIYRISYMWYSALGALLTIGLGIIISVVTDAITRHRIRKITQKASTEDVNNVVVVSENSKSKLNTVNMKNETISESYQQQKESWKINTKSGIDNLALKIDDEH